MNRIHTNEQIYIRVDSGNSCSLLVFDKSRVRCYGGRKLQLIGGRREIHGEFTVGAFVFPGIGCLVETTCEIITCRRPVLVFRESHVAVGIHCAGEPHIHVLSVIYDILS